MTDLATETNRPLELMVDDEITAGVERILNTPWEPERGAGLIRRTHQLAEAFSMQERSLLALLGKIRGGGPGNGAFADTPAANTPSNLVNALDQLERRQKTCAKLLQEVHDAF